MHAAKNKTLFILPHPYPRRPLAGIRFDLFCPLGAIPSTTGYINKSVPGTFFGNIRFYSQFFREFSHSFVGTLVFARFFWEGRA